MLKIILGGFVISLIIVGLSDFLNFLWQTLITPKKRPKTVLAVFLDGKDDYSSLYWFLHKIRWHGKALCDVAVAITNEAFDSENLKKFENTGIVFLEDEEVKKYGEINERFEAKGNG